jgi:hypothetical protein
MAKEAGCDEFLPKPVSSDKCLEIMAELLKN